MPPPSSFTILIVSTCSGVMPSVWGVNVWRPLTLAMNRADSPAVLPRVSSRISRCLPWMFSLIVPFWGLRTSPTSRPAAAFRYVRASVAASLGTAAPS